MARIYLSSSFRDLMVERAAVTAALRGAGHEVIAMEHYPPTSECPTDRCRADAQGSDLYLGLFARRYGYMPSSGSVAITEIEYRSAVAARKPAAIFLLDDTVQWPAEWNDRMTGEGQGGKRIDELRHEFCARHGVGFFSTTDELIAGACAAVAETRA
jgi:hypothetical protein